MAQGQGRLMHALPPVAGRAQPVQKNSGQGGIQAGTARIVSLAAHYREPQANETGGLFVILIHGKRRHDAVAVESVVSDGGQGRSGLLRGNFPGLGPAALFLHQAGGGQQFRALGRVVAQIVQRQAGAGLCEPGRMFDPLADPGHGLQNVRRADTAVLVRIQQRQGAGVEFQAVRGAAQGHPEFGVQLIQLPPFLIRAQKHLIQAAHAAEGKGGAGGRGGSVSRVHVRSIYKRGVRNAPFLFPWYSRNAARETVRRARPRKAAAGGPVYGS